MTDRPVTWFRSGHYAGKNSEGRERSRWHIPRSSGYRRGEIYLRVIALCGYELNSLRVLVDMSIAKGKPSGARVGDLCRACQSKKEKIDV